MNICIVGIGYVGISNAILLSQNNAVTLLDIDESKVKLINSKKSPLNEKLIIDYLSSGNLDLIATTDVKSAFENKDLIIIAVPTNFDPDKNKFDTSIIDSVIKDISLINPNALVIIKSTVPIGYTDNCTQKYKIENLIFCPEFLREGKSLEDSLFPSRIIIGGSSEAAKEFVKILLEGASTKDIKVIYTKNKEAESIKLFANTFLAMRVSFFNELDTYALENNLSSRDIIDGVCEDPRIGKFYNNPSFGYGGYCLPKDTKQLLSSFNGIDQELMHAIVQSNKTRMDFLVQKIINLGAKKIGIYRLIMKEGSDNWRESSLLNVANILIESKVKVFVYEPLMSPLDVDRSIKFVDTLESLDQQVDLILANRMDEKILKYESKVFSRDVYGDN